MVNKNCLRVLRVWYSQSFLDIQLGKVLSINKVEVDQSFPHFVKWFTVGSQQLDNFRSALHFCSPYTQLLTKLLKRFRYTCNICSPHNLKTDSLPLIFSFPFFPIHTSLFSFPSMDTTLQHAFSLSPFCLWYRHPLWYICLLFSWELLPWHRVISWSRGSGMKPQAWLRKVRESKTDLLAVRNEKECQVEIRKPRDWLWHQSLPCGIKIQGTSWACQFPHLHNWHANTSPVHTAGMTIKSN